MFKKYLFYLLSGVFLIGIVSLVKAQSYLLKDGKGLNTKIGGHVKINLYDLSDGKRTNVLGNEIDGKTYRGFGFDQLILYFSQELTDKVSAELQPFFGVDTGATPIFGSNIGDQKIPAAAVTPQFKGWIRAYLKYALPMDYELSAGILKPRFTWEYSAEYYWEDEFNGSKFAVNNFLGAINDTGLELYKNFELGNLSLPSYLYLLNGGNGNANEIGTTEFSDNNRQIAALLHLEPEIGFQKAGNLKVLGSYYGGRYDNGGNKTASRWAAGLAYSWETLAFRGEYAAGNWEDGILNPDLTTSDAKPKGYYAKIFYRPVQWVRFMLHYNSADQDFQGALLPLGTPGKEKYTTITPGIQLYATDSSIIQLQYDIANWKQKNSAGNQIDKLKFNRFIVGWRTTF